MTWLVKTRLALMLAAPFALGACAATTAPAEPVRVGAEGQCDATEAQAWLGKTATAGAGAELLAMTGARTLRWVPPRTAVTMDFRPGRLTVSYDDTMTIDRISCG